MSYTRYGSMRLIYVSLFAVLLLLSAAAYPATIHWMMGEAPPLSWGVDYFGASLSNVVIISGGLNQAYDNKWVAEIAAGGTPTVTVNTSNNTIELWFDPSGLPDPDDPIPTLLDPVCGLILEIGPLEDGNYTFICTNSVAASTLHIQLPPPLIAPEPTTSAFIVGALCCLLKKRRIHA